MFDEPTSYLDIKQRLKISKFIKSIADENTAVMVIEHDLIILDAMTDLIHIMYGKEGCYGIVSQTKSTKNGINIYLSGFLKEENMRFRDHEIKFEQRPPIKTQLKEKITGWKDIEKKLGKFHLTAKQGDIYKKEVIGILGENGIGKTSFVKLLAEIEKPDKGKITEKVKVSYKPQYIDTNSDELVMSVLQDAIQKYTTQLINPLHIKPLLMKPLNELSGGELQRVAIVSALSNDVDLYLLDEPSAYLDVEQRLIVSKVIRAFVEEKGKTALVVDHDLLFLDYLSLRLLVFEGIPAIKGEAKGPFAMEEGMNMFLKDLGITFRRDPENNRPRTNKEDSVKDREQKSAGKYYYV
jgi:ATP-binding cassette subfamily E protein 1